MPCRSHKTRSPAVWSECSWVKHIAVILSGNRFICSSRLAVSLPLNPASIKMAVLPEPIYVELPELPLPKIQKVMLMYLPSPVLTDLLSYEIKPLYHDRTYTKQLFLRSLSVSELCVSEEKMG
jgi:hypothetical protein